MVWARFGDVTNYVEPFAGSLAVLLGRPHQPRVETVNDIDCYLANFWRAVTQDPEAVAAWADWPVNEADLHARHLWLVKRPEFSERMMTDPYYFDAQVAGWWVWGISMWIGSGWCRRLEWRGRASYGAARGIHAFASKDRADGTPHRGRPELKTGRGVNRNFEALEETPWRKRMDIGRGFKGIHRTGIAEDTAPTRKRPNISGFGQRGVHRQIPDLSGNDGAVGRGIHAKRLSALAGYMTALAERLRRVRVCCGDWERLLGPSPTWKIGMTGVFLDPPYGAGADRDPDLYAEDDLTLARRVRDWAVKNGGNPKLRIALCGYEGEHEMPADWEVVAWKAVGGYGVRGDGKGRRNCERERIWFSPGCLGKG